MKSKMTNACLFYIALASLMMILFIISVMSDF